MKKSTITIIFLFFYFSLFSQSYEWTLTNTGSYSSRVRDMIIDTAGNIYTVGSFLGTVDFDPGVGVESHTAIITTWGDDNLYLQKLDADGNFLWVKTWYSTEWSFYGYDLLVDSEQNIYMLGALAGLVDFDPNAGVYEVSEGGGIDDNSDGFVLKLDSDGNFDWVKTYGSSNAEVQFTSFLINNHDDIFIIGKHGGNGFLDFGLGDFAVDYNTYLFKIDSDGNSLFKKDLTSINKHDSDIALDDNGYLYIIGRFNGSIDFEFGSSTTTLSATAGTHTFIQKLDSNGDLIWVKQIGKTGSTRTSDIHINNSDNSLYITGKYSDTTDFDPSNNVNELIHIDGYEDMYIVKLDLDGNFIWVNDLESTTSSVGTSITVDEHDNVYLTGYFYDTITQPLNIIGEGATDMFSIKYNTNGDLLWFYTYGDLNADSGTKLISNKDGALYTAGNYNGTVDFDPTSAIDQFTSGGPSAEMFIQKLRYSSSTVDLEDAITSNLQIYPNPSVDYFHIALPSNTAINENSTLTIIDLSGKLIKSELLLQNQQTINTKSIKKGIYIIQVTCPNQNFYSKITIE